jgi:hypothetical protein
VWLRSSIGTTSSEARAAGLLPKAGKHPND